MDTRDTRELARTMGMHTLDAEGKPVPATDVLEWAAWMAHHDRHVALERLGHYAVSTVFVGIDMARHRGGPPQFYETMVFGRCGGPMPGCTWRAATEEEARAAHATALDYARKLVSVDDE